jgi:PGF-CTERM protein
MSKMQLALIFTAFMLMGAIAMPAYAQQTAVPDQGITYVPINGSIAFDPNNFNNITSVTQLTVYARNASGFDTRANPTADGNFTMSVPGADTYIFFVMPNKLDYLNTTTNATYSILYPDAAAFPFSQNVTVSGLSGVVIPTKYQQTGLEMSVTPLPPSVGPSATAQPTPGFTVIAAILALGAIVAIAYRRK